MAITADEIVKVMDGLGIDAPALTSVLGSWALVQRVRVLDAQIATAQAEAAAAAGEWQAKIEGLTTARNEAQAAADAAMGQAG